MRPSFTAYLIVAAVAAGSTMLLVPFCRLIARWTGLVAQPDSRRLHSGPTPILGGAAMYVGFVIAFVFAWLSGWFDAVFTGSTEPIAILAGATVAFFVGLIDDVKEISPPAKIAGLCLVGGLLAGGGVSIIWFRVPFLDVFVLPYDLALLVSVFWVLGMTNAVNFIDGLDGLAAGIIGIGATAFLLYGVRLGQVELLFPGNVGPLTAALAAGVCIGFLPWNVHPAQIFMGDAGSLLLGTLMAASTMAVGGRTPDPFSGQTFFFYAPLAIPILILGVPMLDTAFAIVRRASRGSGLATADKDHLHHRLVRLGHGHRRSVSILWAWTALLSALVLYPTYNEGEGDGIVPIGVGALALLLYTLFHPGIRPIGPSSDELRARWATFSPTFPRQPKANRPTSPSKNGTEPKRNKSGAGVEKSLVGKSPIETGPVQPPSVDTALVEASPTDKALVEPAPKDKALVEQVPTEKLPVDGEGSPGPSSQKGSDGPPSKNKSRRSPGKGQTLRKSESTLEAPI